MYGIYVYIYVYVFAFAMYAVKEIVGGKCTCTVFTRKIATGGGGGSKSGKNPPVVAELLPDVTPT